MISLLPRSPLLDLLRETRVCLTSPPVLLLWLLPLLGILDCLRFNRELDRLTSHAIVGAFGILCTSEEMGFDFSVVQLNLGDHVTGNVTDTAVLCLSGVEAVGILIAVDLNETNGDGEMMDNGKTLEPESVVLL